MSFRDSGLTARQCQIVELVCAGWTNREIAAELHVSEGSTKEYLGRLYKKLGLHTRTELAVWAIAPDTWERLNAAGKGELFLQVLGEQDQCKEMALEQAEK